MPLARLGNSVTPPSDIDTCSERKCDSKQIQLSHEITTIEISGPGMPSLVLGRNPEQIWLNDLKISQEGVKMHP